MLSEFSSHDYSIPNVTLAALIAFILSSAHFRSSAFWICPDDVDGQVLYTCVLNHDRMAIHHVRTQIFLVHQPVCLFHLCPAGILVDIQGLHPTPYVYPWMVNDMSHSDK